MARSWELGSAQSSCCRLWVEAALPPTRKPPRTEALQTRAFSGRRTLARENCEERTVVMRSPGVGAGSGPRSDTHDAGVEPSPHQLIHQRRGQRCVGPQEPGEGLVLSQVFPHRQSWGSRVRQRVSLPRHPPPPVLTPALVPAVPEPAQGGQEPGKAVQEPLPVAAEQDLPRFAQEAGEAATWDTGRAVRPRAGPALPRSSPGPPLTWSHRSCPPRQGPLPPWGAENRGCSCCR